MLERIAGNEELKSSIRRMLEGRRLTHSVLLAFAMLYPEVQVLLFFVIPIRVKYFGWFAAALWALSFLGSGMMGKLNDLLCMLNFVVFFGPQAWRSVRAWVRREQWKRKNRR